MGTVVRSFLPIRSPAGKTQFSSGDAQYDSRPKYKLDCFFIMLFTIWTARSAAPLLWGYLGELVTCLKLYSFIKSLNFSELCRVPLPEMTSSWIPSLGHLSHALLGNSDLIKGSRATLALTQDVVQLRIISAICCDIPGYQTHGLAWSLHSVTPEWPWWKIRRTCSPSSWGIMIRSSKTTSPSTIEILLRDSKHGRSRVSLAVW